MQQFEYLLVQCTGNVIPTEQLNELGKQSWRLITISNFVGYLERPLKTAPKKKAVKRANK